MMKNTVFLFFYLLFGVSAAAQVVYTEPVFPRITNEVTVYFDASKGTGGLADCDCDVYIHTGVITTESTTPSDWKHVQQTWGVANPAWQLDPVPGEPNLYTFVISPSIEEYYDLNEGEEVLELAMVFRNGDGSLEGKGDGGSDIFYPVYPEDLPFSGILLSPEASSSVVSLNDNISVRYATSENAEITLTQDGTELTTVTGNLLDYEILVTEPGNHTVEITAVFDGEMLTESFSYVVPEVTNIAPLPAGAEVGINVISDTEVTLVIRAPGKESIFVLGTFTDYALSTDFQMNRTADGEYFWLNVTGLSPDENYFYQYVVDGGITVADPLSLLILDPQADGGIDEETFPDLPGYPEQMSGRVTWLQTAPEEYEWEVNDFERPDAEKMVVYELLMRDFLAAHNYQTLLDTLDYLDNLGVNAIELMPVNEFENNNSWGYNPSYHKALDKYYGTPTAFKRVIDECHARGIAVILDVVYNHAFGQNPFVQMWFDGKPTDDNPYFNRDARHPFNVGFDMNHESEATREYTKNIMEYWISEFRVDGFRFDLSKGFTQVNNPNDVGAWGNYDPSRIAIWDDYSDFCWSVGGEDFYVILEHFADSQEEQELTAMGMMTWGNTNHNYRQASAGRPSNNIYGVTHLSRGFSAPRLIGYMESHDEERLMVENLENGATSAANDYFIPHLYTALRRQELVSAFFYPIVGPKMLWQFGEIGYDVSIDFNGRTGPKPILWDYLDEEPRRRLYDITSTWMALRNDYSVFHELGEYPAGTNVRKRIGIEGDEFDAIIIGNFGVTPTEINPEFFSTGTWYEYFSGLTIDVSDTEAEISLQPGEWLFYTSVDLPEPDMGYIDTYTGLDNLVNADFALSVTPNPAHESPVVSYTLTESAEVEVELFDTAGRWLGVIFKGKQTTGVHRLTPDNLLPGSYLVRLRADAGVQAVKLIVH